VNYEKYQLPHPAMLRRLKANNYTVDAHYLAADDGSIDSVFLYQDGKFICECKKIQKYNTAKAEWADTDAEAFTEQTKYVSQHRKMVKDGRDEISKLTILENEPGSLSDDEGNVEVFIAKNNQDNIDTPDNNPEDDINSALNNF